jgi:hypothetical protein
VLMFFWILAPCRLVGRYQHFGETYYHLKVWRWRQYVSTKRWNLPMSVHGAKTQNNIMTQILFPAGIFLFSKSVMGLIQSLIQ